MTRREQKQPNGVEIGQRVEARRKALGLTRRELADQSQLTESYIYRLESGRHPYPSPQTVEALALALGLEVDELTGTADEQPTPVMARPGQETVAEMLRRLAPSPEFAREVERFMRLSLADMRRMNEIVDRIIQLEEGPPDEGDNEGSDPDDVRTRKAKLNNPKELHGEPQTATG